MEMARITQKREYYVVKRNDLIRKSRYSLTVQQQKMLYYLISQIKPMDEENKEYEININEFCKLCGYDTNNGYYYTALKDDLKALADKSAWIDADDGTSSLFRWIDTAIIKRNSGVMKIRFHSTVAPYLFELVGFYTQYSLFHLLAMKCKYSMRMYEYLLSLKYKYQFKVDIDELKKRIDAENYDKFSHFKVRVLEPAIEEINKYTDIQVEYKLVKEGRAYSQIEFTVKTKGEMAKYIAQTTTANTLDDTGYFNQRGKKQKKESDE
jgi:plasmid replication initiation protein